MRQFIPFALIALTFLPQAAAGEPVPKELEAVEAKFKQAGEITVPGNSKMGVPIGALKEGSIVAVQIVSGLWKSSDSEAAISPDSTDAKPSACVAIGSVSFTAATPVSFIHSFKGTGKGLMMVAKPAKSTSYAVLRMNDTADVANNTGSVKCRVLVLDEKGEITFPKNPGAATTEAPPAPKPEEKPPATAEKKPASPPPPVLPSLKITETPPAASQKPAEPEIAKIAVPDTAKQTAASKTIREANAADFKGATLEAKSSLAKKLLTLVADEKDDAMRYALLKEARESAVAGADVITAMRAIDLTAKYFNINPFAEKSVVFKRVVELTKTQEQHKALGDSIYDTIRAAIDADSFDELKNLSTTLLKPIVHIQDKDLAEKWRSQNNIATDIAQDWPSVKTGLEKLKSSPNDPAMNLIVGKFYCFLREDWSRGLPMLQLGSNKVIATLAEEENKTPTAADAQLKVADGWWDFAEKANASVKQGIKVHAADWYKRALIQQEKLSKSRAELRIDEVLGRNASEKAFFEARSRSYPKALTLDLPNGAKMDFVLIPAGRFMMGDNAEELAKPAHQVTISKPFYMTKYEVTMEQGRAALKFGTPPDGDQSRFAPQMPLWGIKAEVAVKFCEALSAASGKTIRLPSEAEWEYACRADSRTKFHNSAAKSDLDKVAWFKSNSGGKLHPVGGKAPNAWGLYDMHGNAAELCADFYEEKFYAKSPPVDPINTTKNVLQVVRGGSAMHEDEQCTSADRGHVELEKAYTNIGFRVVMEIAP